MYMVRVRVPSVRPLVRCTLKRVLRVMPSVLLLLFVFSLIFVTLMQIAVIHAHRRAHYVPRHELNATPTPPAPGYSQDAGKLQVPPGVSATKVIPHKRPETLRVEAFLDKNAPSVEANMVIMQQLVNSARIRHILSAVTPQLDTYSVRDAKNSRRKSTVSHRDYYNDLVRVRSLMNWTSSLHLTPAQVTVPSAGSSVTISRTKVPVKCCVGNDTSSTTVVTRHKPPCPLVPTLAGRLKVDMSSRRREDVEDLLRRSPYMRGRGSWTPKDCMPLHRVAIIIPYRDRLEHLATLLYTLHPLLQRQLLEYNIYVVEQHGNDTFNKGVLMNAGVREALRDGDFHCFVFHDVDMIPEDDRNMYSCPPMPRHMSVAVDKFNYSLPYSLLVGGVFSIRTEHFLLVNGYSNLYWGWGGEDDDMAYRIKYRKLEIIRPPESLARYTMIKHDHRPESPNAIRTALLRMAKKRSPRDGLNTVKYKILWRHDLLPYTHLMIDIGKHHRWQFLNGQRLIINF